MWRRVRCVCHCWSYARIGIAVCDALLAFWATILFGTAKRNGACHSFFARAFLYDANPLAAFLELQQRLKAQLIHSRLELVHEIGRILRSGVSVADICRFYAGCGILVIKRPDLRYRFLDGQLKTVERAGGYFHLGRGRRWLDGALGLVVG